MAMMNREQMITACVDDQIERKIIPAESRSKQIRWRLNGGCEMRKMGWMDCYEWYVSVFRKDPEI